MKEVNIEATGRIRVDIGANGLVLSGQRTVVLRIVDWEGREDRSLVE